MTTEEPRHGPENGVTLMRVKTWRWLAVPVLAGGWLLLPAPSRTQESTVTIRAPLVLDGRGVTNRNASGTGGGARGGGAGGRRGGRDDWRDRRLRPDGHDPAARLHRHACPHRLALRRGRPGRQHRRDPRAGRALRRRER